MEGNKRLRKYDITEHTYTIKSHEYALHTL